MTFCVISGGTASVSGILYLKIIEAETGCIFMQHVGDFCALTLTHCYFSTRIVWSVSLLYFMSRFVYFFLNVCWHWCDWELFHSHWHTVVEFLDGLVVNSDGNLSIGIEGKLNVVAASALPLVPRQLHVLVTSVNTISVLVTDRDGFLNCVLSGWRSHLTNRRVSLRMLTRLRRVFTGS